MEDRKVFEYMNLYGIQNVRGGSFCKVKLSNEETNILKRIINTEEDTCFICNSPDHMSTECCNRNKKNKNNKKYKKQIIIDDDSEETSEETSEDYSIDKPLSCCQKFFNYFTLYS